MTILVDMNLSPGWAAYLIQAGYPAVHWSTVGKPNDSDQVVMEYARIHDLIVFTHDLDFGALLNLTKSHKPSVIQIRIQDVTPLAAGQRMIFMLQQFKTELAGGALVVLDSSRNRVRVLPLG